jgi:glutamyl-tRNA synthetase
MEMRTRIAPAPSGSIHVGNARTALYNWLLARHSGGRFVLRVEDTDKKRATQEAYEAVIEDMRWLGLGWDEGPEVGGPYEPYRQSERTTHHEEAATKLLDSGAAYDCYCTSEEVEARRKAAGTKTPGYDGYCRNLGDEERRRFESEGRSPALRFAVPHDRTISFEDVVRGTISSPGELIPDFIIRRSDGSPTYILAAAVDDIEMKITHIVRGEDLIPATPRQLLIREALGVEDTPVFGHLPLLVNPDGKPLSKRWGDVAVAAYRDQGFTREAMVNYLALLGWSFDASTNIFSVDDLVEKFSLERVGKNPATFDVQKLEWLNQHYIKNMSPAELADRLLPFCERAGIEIEGDQNRSALEEVVPLISERIKRLTEAPDMIRFLFGPVEPDEKAKSVLADQDDYLSAVGDALEGLEKWTTSAIEEALRALAEERELKPKKAFQPIRAAVTGTLISPPLFESLEILGPEETIERIRAAAAD